jgi:hypothetical protein
MVDILDIDISISWELFHNNRIIEKNEKLSTIIFLIWNVRVVCNDTPLLYHNDLSLSMYIMIT